MATSPTPSTRASLSLCRPSDRSEVSLRVAFERGRLRDNGDDVIIAGMTSLCMLCIVFRLASASATDTLQAAQPEQRGHTFHTTCKKKKKKKIPPPKKGGKKKEIHLFNHLQQENKQTNQPTKRSNLHP